MLNIAKKALYYVLAVFLNLPLLWHFPKTNLFIRLKQKSKMFNKLCFTRSRSRTRANSEEGAICNNILQLKAIYYSIVTRSSILNVDRGPRPDVIRMSFVCHSYVIHMCSYITRMWIQFNTILHLVRMSLVCARMWLVCHSYVIRMYSYITLMSLVFTRMSLVCARM